MGCDIHMIAEAKRTFSEKTEWDTIGRMFKDPYWKEDQLSTISQYDDEDGEYEWNERYTTEPYSGRNYNLFAILADVRNGRGFAGIKTGQGFNPIAEPKGIPDDASFYTKKFLNSYGADGHSHSYFTLKELKEYDWAQVTNLYGVVDAKGYQEFKINGKPSYWSGEVWGGGVSKVSNQEMDNLIKNDPDIVNAKWPNTRYHTSVEWSITYAESVGSFLTETIPNLEKLLAFDNVEDVRILFFFDN